MPPYWDCREQPVAGGGAFLSAPLQFLKIILRIGNAANAATFIWSREHIGERPESFQTQNSFLPMTNLLALRTRILIAAQLDAGAEEREVTWPGSDVGQAGKNFIREMQVAPFKAERVNAGSRQIRWIEGGEECLNHGASICSGFALKKFPADVLLGETLVGSEKLTGGFGAVAEPIEKFW